MYYYCLFIPVLQEFFCILLVGFKKEFLLLSARSNRMEVPSVSKQLIDATIERGKGVVMAQTAAVVYRGTYAGRNIIAKNSKRSPETTDERGYLPVEWWIMSKTEALNPVSKKGEGLTNLQLLGGQHIAFDKALKIAEEKLLGSYADRWPLTKVM